MEERPEPEADGELELTPEEIVAADAAMLLDLGGAEQLADLIADQSLGERHSSDTAADAATNDEMNPPPEDEGHPASPK